MTRFFRRSVLLVLTIGAALMLLAPFMPSPAQASPPSEALKSLLLARIPGGDTMFLRLNGSPLRLGVITSAGTTTANAFSIPNNSVLAVVCDAAAFCIEGATASTSYTNAAFGMPMAAGVERYFVPVGTGTGIFSCVGAGAFNCVFFQCR